MSDIVKDDNREYNDYKQKIWRAQNSLRSRLPKRVLKRKELWEKDKTTYQRFKINAGVIWRRFNTQTHGFGMIMVMIGIMSIVPMIIILTAMSNVYDSMSEINRTRYREGLELSCTNQDFYSWNFRACEDIEVRPLQPQIAPRQEPELPKESA